jgi:intracellular sulfur oxidation DsrE/DsrF family protein
MKQRLVLVASVLMLSAGLIAAESASAHPMTSRHKVVFQVDSASPAVQNLVLNNAANLQRKFGSHGVTIEVVAYGPGLSILTNKSAVAQRVEHLSKDNIRFSACHNSMEAFKRKTGKMPVLLQGVKVVPSGVARIVSLEEKGYSYIRP